MSNTNPLRPAAYDNLSWFQGDIHSHCDISYGHGSLEDALQNARLQLDFASITAHAHWPDLPADDPRLAAVNTYHRIGFERASSRWPRYREVSNAANTDGSFVTFLSFEWHSLKSGDHNVYYRGDHGEILPADSLEDLRRHLRNLNAQGTDALLIPHHIGYRQGYRGINWDEYTTEFSPFVEVFSMHGASESDEAPYPYLHTMGPLDGRSTMQHGLAMGHVFGVVGSTDSHSAHPGSFGHGRMAAWAPELTRDALWDAFTSRRTVALTGDNIQVAFALNDHPVGSVAPFDDVRELEISVTGEDTLDYVEVIHNNRVLARWDVLAQEMHEREANVHLELGWGEHDAFVDWSIDLTVERGRLLGIEPRFRGWDIVSPQQSTADTFTFSHINHVDNTRVAFTTRSWPNPTTVTPGTQGVSLHVEGDYETMITGTVNGQPVDVSLADLRSGSRVGYLGGFLSPAYRFHRAAPRSTLVLNRTLRHRSTGPCDWYYIRARQKNNQWAWSSPIWVQRDL